MNSLLAKALLAFLAMPGLVAFVIPLFMLGSVSVPIYTPGLLVVAVGTLLLLWCVRDFYVAGKGTLAPWSPPTRLVTTGLYRLSRNPMYVAVVTILFGWAWAFQSRPHVIYAAFLAVAFYLRVVYFEEPWLAVTHGDEWRRYRTQVPRRFLW